MRVPIRRGIPRLVLTSLLSAGLTAPSALAARDGGDVDPAARALAGKITFKTTTPKVLIGTNASFVGKVKARKGTKVSIQQRKTTSSKFAPQGRTKVKKNGRISYTEAISTVDDRYYRACYVKRGRAKCSKPTFVDVVKNLPQQPAYVAVAATSPGAIEAGQAVSVSGSASPNLVGQPIRLEAYYAEKWGQVGSASVDGNANFTVSGTLTAAGRSVPLRVVVDATTTTTSAAANAAAVTVFGWYYLSDRFEDPVEGYWYDTGALSVNGTTFPNSVEMYSSSSSDEEVVQVDLARGCTKFAATAGLTSYNQSTDQAAVRLFADSTQVYSQSSMVLTASYPIVVDVTNALRLKLTTTSLTSSGVGMTFGDARALCAF